MRIIPSCENCLLDRQRTRVQNMPDEAKKAAYLQEVQEILAGRKEEDCAPYIVYQFNQVFQRYFGALPEYAEIKKEYNSLVMSMEKEIEDRIEASEDPLHTSMLFSRIGNYIDFGAMNKVERSRFLELMEQKAETVSGQEGAEAVTERNEAAYRAFCRDCETSGEFLLLCDNCGEIVLDKLFLRQLRRRYPHLRIRVMVRGYEALNDATMEDAVFCGIADEAEVIGNGSSVAGTVPEMISDEARSWLDEADVIFSKGQGNYESLAGCGKNIYFSFLCKCPLFTSRFSVPLLTGILVSERKKD